MSVVYLVTVFFVTALLLSIPLFPFWKVWERLKTHHPDIWNAKGPFEISALLTMPGIVGAFLEVVDAVTKDEALKRRDPDLAKWCIMVQGVRSMAPRSFPAQVGYFFIFLYFTGFLTSVLMSPFKH